ncbi:-Probable exosome complex exonuclease 1 [Babesia bigemina]|uniref:-Probable exosome complex exonuclease 1 n=1 Tax=Babesia bigemina TaxID=5866 RepID=A0A061DB66_BABBI|nr:-Probable exosome complex exonuclease 1 [Babesia bigemina]CDR97926.1 -Probable exosome complex exonuclease 1 [Babesia bigemina]|eukprot:XP_012770112.1 -Probable exosome complex exonuclease 1 [Babesia bigemina]
MKARVALSASPGVRSADVESRALSVTSPPEAPLSESFTVQKVLLILGGHDGSPLFTQVSPHLDSRERVGQIPELLRVSVGLQIAHLSPGAVRNSLDVFSHYGSCTLLLSRLLNALSESGYDSNEVSSGAPLAPSLACLLKSPSRHGTKSRSLFNWSWPVWVPGLCDGLHTIWNEWCWILSSLHRRFVSSLYREFCGVEALPDPNHSAALSVCHLMPADSKSPFLTSYLERCRVCPNFGSDVEGHESGAGGVSEFKVTLLNLYYHLRPFLSMLEDVVGFLESILNYMDTHALNIGSLYRVSFMFLLLHLRRSEDRQDDALASLWRFLLRHTLSQCNIPHSLGATASVVPGDISWACLGAPLHALRRVRDSLEQLGQHKLLSESSNISDDLYRQSDAFEPTDDTADRILNKLNDCITQLVSGSIVALRSVLEDRHNLTAHLSFLSGFCCLRFGDCLDSVFEFVCRPRVPLNYQSRLKSVLVEGTVQWQQVVDVKGVPVLSTDQVVSLVNRFEYLLKEDAWAPIIELKVLGGSPCALSSFLSDRVMAHYSSILRHLLSFQLLFGEVKQLVQLTLRGSGSVCGFFVPRATTLLLHVCFALDHYYRWVVASAWSELLRRLSACATVSEMSAVHESYVEFLLECLLVTPECASEPPACRINPLFSESLFLIRRCASEFLRICTSELDDAGDELGLVYMVLQSEVGRLKCTLNVLSSHVLPDVPEFGESEHELLSLALRHRVNLNSAACRAQPAARVGFDRLLSHFIPVAPTDVTPRSRQGASAEELHPAAPRFDVGVSCSAAGSSYVTVGDTKVKCCVNAPRPCGRRVFDERGLLTIDVRFSRPELRRSCSFDVCSVLSDVFERHLLLRRYPHQLIEAWITIEEDAGGLFCACITGLCIAFADGGIQMPDIISAASAYAFRDPQGSLTVALDLSDEEASYYGQIDPGLTKLHLAYCPNMNTIACLLQSGEHADSAVLNKMLTMAQAACGVITAEMQASLQDYVEWVQERNHDAAPAVGHYSELTP